MKNSSIIASGVLGISLAIGILCAGYFIGDGLYRVRAAGRYVTVKGLAERYVPADLVIWPLTYNETGNDLSDLQQRLDDHKKMIVDFFIASGFKPSLISESAPIITDFQGQMYSERNRPKYRYKAQMTVTLRTKDASKVKQAMKHSGELVKRGIVLVKNYERATEFLFTGLNKIKPEMIAEATKNARKAAEQFARDSGSKVGAIRTARQGLFSIQNRDANSPDIKRVRVVTTVQYFLEGE